jgi:hypothetical protein
VCVRVCVCVCVCVCTRIYIIRTYVYIHTHAGAYIHTYTHTHTRDRRSARGWQWVYSFKICFLTLDKECVQDSHILFLQFFLFRGEKFKSIDFGADVWCWDFFKKLFIFIIFH